MTPDKATNPPMTLEEQIFDCWLFLEAVMIFATVLSNILFLFFRSLERTKLEFTFGLEVDEQADHKYMTSRWVITEKQNKTKARLVVRGF